MNKTLRVTGFVLVITLLTVGFVSAEKAGHVSILPMPSVAESDSIVDGGDESMDEAIETDGADGMITDETPAEADVESEIQSESLLEEDAVQKTSDTALSFEQGWTEEELAALRELAQERIRAKEAMAELEQLKGDVTEYLHELWNENIEPMIRAMEAHRGERHPNKEELIESLDRWLERVELPKTDEIMAGWERLIERFAGSTGVAFEDAKDIGEEWLEDQRELMEDVLEDLEELRHDMHSADHKA